MPALSLPFDTKASGRGVQMHECSCGWFAVVLDHVGAETVIEACR